MFIHYRTQGIILKKEDRSEADQLFTIYTKNFGRIEILGKAIRKISSKLRSGTELFYLSEIEFIQGKAYKTLTDAIPIEKFANLKKDLKKLVIAYKISQTLDSLISGQEPDERIWQLLKEVFLRLTTYDLRLTIPKDRTLNVLSARPTGQAYNLQLIYYYFFWNLVSLLGYQPEIQNCAIQGKKINCDIVKIIKVILRKDWQLLIRLKLTPDHLKLLKNVSKWYIKNIGV